MIKVAVMDGVETDRATLKAAATTTLANYIAGTGASGNLDAGAAAKTVTVALYWPQSDVDNDYNLKNGLKADDGDSKLYIDLYHRSVLGAER